MPNSDVTGLSGDAPDELQPDSGAEPAEDRATPSATMRVLQLTLFMLACAAGLFLLTSLSQHAVPNNSDSSTVVLEGYAIAHGNVLLHNWSLSLDSFWTVDAPFYALGYLLVGLRPVLVNFIPALLGLLVIVLGACIARDGVRGRAAVVAVTSVAVFLFLPSHALSYFLLQGPWHIGTALWCLLAFWGLRRGNFGWGWGMAIVLLAAGLLGDIQALVLGVLPILGAGLIAIARTRSWRSGAAPISAAVASVGLAEGIREIALRIGTFTFSESHHTAKAAQAEHNLGHLLRWGGALLGVNEGPYGGVHIPLALELAHLLAALCILACLVVAVLFLLRGAVLGKNRGEHAGTATWRLDDLLVVGIVGDFVVFEALTLSDNILYARYLTVGVIFSVILAARLLGRASTAITSGVAARITAALGVVLAVSFGIEAALELNSPVPAQPVVALDNFLLAHHLRTGIGDYWAASIVSVQSEGAIEVYPVVANLQKIIVPDGRQASASWYKQTFQFLVYQNLPYGRVEATTVAGTFGTPTTTFVVGAYHVAVWNHPITVSGPAFP